MKDQDKVKEQLLADIKRLRKRIAELEKSERKYKQTEETLKESEEKYRTLVNDASDAIIMADESGRILDTNRKMETLLGYTKEELFSKNIVHIHPEEELLRAIKTFKDIISKGSGSIDNCCILTKNGKSVHVDISGSLVRYSGKSVIQGIFRDITGRKESEDVLKESEEQFRSLFQNSIVGIILTIHDGRIIAANPAALKMFGYSEDEMRGIGRNGLIDTRDVRLPALLVEIARTGKFKGEIRLVRKNGMKFPAVISSSAFHTKEGFERTVIIINDITDIKRAEEKFRDIFEKSPMGIFQSTFEGKFIDVNPALAQMMGYASPQEVVESIHNIADQIYVDPKQRDEVVKIIKKTPEAVRFESMFYKKDGKKWAGKLTMRLIHDENGRPHHLDGFIEDITQQKMIEEKLHKAMQQLEMLSRRLLEVQEAERRHIARELHDEIGQVLTAVKINLQAVERSGDRQISAMVPLTESIKIIDRLLGQVRSLSIELHPSILDDLGLLAALRWYIDWISQQAGLSGKLVTKFTGKRLTPVIELTCFRITQEALTNTVRHANAKNVIVELGRDNNELYLKVKDDGVGFDVKKAHERALEGKCLGLLGMEERVLLLGGRIEFKSKRGKGTEIQVFLPFNSSSNIKKKHKTD